MFKFILAIFLIIVVGAFTQQANASNITIPSNAKVVYGGEGCNSDRTPWSPSYRASINTLYWYSCDNSGRVAQATNRVIDRSINNAAWQIESSVQHGINRQISDLGYKLDKIFGRY